MNSPGTAVNLLPDVRRLLLAAFLLLCRLSCPFAVALEPSIRVTAYQGPCHDGDFAANLATTRDLVAKARGLDAHFLSLPECFLSGYHSREAIERGARSLDDPDLRAFIAESADHDLVILAGLARRTGRDLFNSVLVIHRGRLLGVYDKILLTPEDRDAFGFTPGSTVSVFQAHGVRFGVILCADSSHPFPALSARLQGAQILFSPHNNRIAAPVAEDHRRWVRNCHVGLACQHQMAIVRANTVTTDTPGQVGYGDAFILSPQGEPLAEAKLFETTLISALLTPDLFRSPHVWGSFLDSPPTLRNEIATLLESPRPPSDDADPRQWLDNMVLHHRFTPDEAAAATGLPVRQIVEAVGKLGFSSRPPAPPPPRAPLKVLPYPGGRHPRLGFFDGAVAPQRETKVSVFTPWADGGYVVADVPEAIFSNLGLTYLAHTHIPTLWDQEGIRLPRLEWNRDSEGNLHVERTLPNGIAFGSRVMPRSDGVAMTLWLRNGTPQPLSGLRVQNCVMLGAATGFQSQSLTNKVFATPFAAARSSEAPRWVITAWERCGRTWGNELVPCLHSDPVFPDCPPGATETLHGWLSFFEGDDVRSEFARLAAAGLPSVSP